MKNNKDDLLDDTASSKSKEENKKEIYCINLLSSDSSASYLLLTDLDNDPFCSVLGARDSALAWTQIIHAG